MPFTVSHAAAVLPLRKLGGGRLPLAALMFGSMSPDYSYFLPGDLAVLPTHTFTGLFWFCLPAGLAIWLLFVHLLEAPTLSLLPDVWRTRIAPSDRSLSLRVLATAAAAVVIGAATHIVWDSFTHRWTPVAEALPFLRTLLFTAGNQPVYVYKLLQHASSLIGFVFLVVWAWRIRKAALVDSRTATITGASTRAKAVAAIILVATSGAFAIDNYLDHADVWFERRLYHFAIGGMFGWMIAWCAVAIGMRLQRAPTSA
jgi:hypothetical protein